MAYDSEASATGRGDGLFMKLRSCFQRDVAHVRDWRKEAKEDFEFYAGKQWSDEDKRELQRKSRPPIVFNRIAPLVNAVVGSEINNRREVQYIPRELGDAKANEILTAAAEWFRDQTCAEDEDSDAFEDAVICGMGWTDTRLEFENEPDGAPLIERIDPMEMVWDCNAVKPNLQDAERMFRVREMSVEAAEKMFPKVPREKLNASWARSENDVNDPHDQDEADTYSGTQGNAGDGIKDNVTIVEARWFEREPYYRGPDLETGQVREYTEQQLVLARRANPALQAVRQTRKVVRRAFLGTEILGQPDNPLVAPGLLGWECVTGYRDKISGTFYGVVRAAKDPQRWTNKFFSQVMFLLNSQSKGGIAAERGAFEDDAQAEQSWAKSDEITWMTKGALSTDKPMIMPKAPAQFPTGFFTLFQESKDEVSQVTGLSPEFVGTREVDQAGVLEMQRRQSSLNLLASLFNSLRRYRKRQGKTMLYLIQNHLSDGRLVRIVGDAKKEYVQLTREAVANLTYDIIVDDAPTSPNEKDRVWSLLMQMMPLVKDMMTPDVALELLRYSPLPASMVEQLQKKAAELAQQQASKPSPEEMQMQAKQAETAIKLEADQQKHQLDMEGKAIELFAKVQSAQIEAQRDQQKLENDARRMAIQEASNAISRQNANSRQTSAANK